MESQELSDSPRVAVREAIAEATSQLEKADIPSSALDAALLMGHVLRLTRGQVLLSPEKILYPNELARFLSLVARRIQYEPIAYILGKKEFWSLDFYVTHDTLIPRPDSETLIESVLKRMRNNKTREQAKPIALLDIGTGSGCLLITLLKELPTAYGIGADNSERALLVARENAKRHGVENRAEFIQSHWCDAIDGTFDLILSNPPYIAQRDSETLMPDVMRYEPHAALFAGEDGLDAYRLLAPQMAKKLNAGGMVCFEVGQDQDRDVSALLAAEGMMVEAPIMDLAGVARCVVAYKQ